MDNEVAIDHAITVIQRKKEPVQYKPSSSVCIRHSGHSIKVVGKPSSHLLNRSIVFNARIDPFSEFSFDPTRKSSVLVAWPFFILFYAVCHFDSNHLVLWVRAEMAEWVRACLQSTLKIVNSVIGLVGMSMILYSLWMIRGWFRETRELSPGFSGSSPPWFIFAFLGLGIFLCVISCSGYIAAETINGHCLSCYTAFVFLLLLLETVITADIFLNRNWEEDFPRDPTGRLDEFKDFVRSNFELCKLISILVLVAQMLSIFLAMVLRSLGPDHGYYYDSDDDAVPARLPLLRNQAQNTRRIADPSLFMKNHPWIVRIHNKIISRN